MEVLGAAATVEAAAVGSGGLRAEAQLLQGLAPPFWRHCGRSDSSSRAADACSAAIFAG